MIYALPMHSIACILCFSFLFQSCYLDRSGWDYISLHCRDNNNAPVDWWFIYKPSSEVLPLFEWGLNFTFITPNSEGRWEPSNKYISSSSMLQYTLAPMFRPTYTDYLAVAIYDERKSSKGTIGSVARGVLMADELGGVWIYHTIPNLVNIKKDRQSFPREESTNGHLLMCLSLDLLAVNAIFRNIRTIKPNFTYFKVAERLKHSLPEWNSLETPFTSKQVKSIQLKAPENILHVKILLKPPGESKSLYKTFASSKNIMLDVYGHSGSICKRNYGVRNINSISLKYPDKVIYINNSTDKMHFAVSTAAHWQKRVKGPLQHWTCISNLDEDVSLIGGDMVCVENYKIWLTFDNLKVKEPEC